MSNLIVSAGNDDDIAQRSVGVVPAGQGVLSRLAPLILFYCATVAARFVIALLPSRPLIPTDELLYKTMASSFFHTGSFYNTAELGYYGKVPNVLYPLLIAPAFWWRANFFVVIKLINALLLGLAVFPAYALARDFVSHRRAVLAAALVVLLPSAALSAFASVDALNLPLFLCCLFYAYRALTRARKADCLAFGFFLALLFLNKPAAAGFGVGFLVACLALCVLHLRRKERNRARRVLASAGLSAVSTLVCFGVLNLVLTGRVLYDLGMYKALDQAFGRPTATGLQILSMVAAHSLTPLALYFVPFFVVTVTVVQLLLRPNRKAEEERLLTLLVLGLAVSIVYVAFTMRFTLTIFNQEHFSRLHARYHFVAYAFSLVGLVICLERIAWSWKVKVALVGLCLVTWAADARYLLPHFVSSPLTLFDNPDLAWSVAPAGTGRIVWALSLVALAALVPARTGRLPRSFVFAFLAVLLFANVGETRHLCHWDGQIGGVTDKKVQFVVGVLPDRRVSVVVFDSALLGRLVLAFWHEYRFYGSYDVPKGSVIGRELIPPGTQYVIAFDVYDFRVPLRELYRSGPYAVYAVE